MRRCAVTGPGPVPDPRVSPRYGLTCDVVELPTDVRHYLAELVRRVRDVCGDHLVSVGAVGSLALGDYRHGRSDIDIAVVVDPAAPAHIALELAEVLAHPGFHCPATGLELVLYDAAFAASGASGAGYRLNLNTGPLLPAVADTESAGAPGFWFVIDRAIGYRSGWTLAGRPIREVFAEPARRVLLAAVSESVREHAMGVGHLPDNRVLNGCRSVFYCRTGRWVAKGEAGRAIADTEARFRPLVGRALRSFELPRDRALDFSADEVEGFLVWVRRVVEQACDSAGG